MNVDRIIAFYETKYDRIIDEEHTRIRTSNVVSSYVPRSERKGMNVCIWIQNTNNAFISEFKRTNKKHANGVFDYDDRDVQKRQKPDCSRIFRHRGHGSNRSPPIPPTDHRNTLQPSGRIQRRIPGNVISRIGPVLASPLSFAWR